MNQNGERDWGRNNSGLVYLHGDHLGSASLTTNNTNGAKIGKLRYTPYGQERWGSGNIINE